MQVTVTYAVIQPICNKTLKITLKLPEKCLTHSETSQKTRT